MKINLEYITNGLLPTNSDSKPAMHDEKNTNIFNTLQCINTLVSTKEKKLPKAIMSLIRHYTVVTPSKLETIIELLEYIVNSNIGPDMKAELKDLKKEAEEMLQIELTPKTQTTFDNFYKKAAESFTKEGVTYEITNELFRDAKEDILVMLIELSHIDVNNTISFTEIYNKNTFVQRQMTPLQRAAQKGYNNLLSLLIDKGANLNLMNGDGYYALTSAAINGHIKTVKILLGKGAPANLPIEFSFSPLMAAASKGYIDIVTLLLEHGANINNKDSHENTALICAAEGGHQEIMSLLINRGADVEAKNKNGDSALMIAAREGRVEIVSLLCNHQANIDEQNMNKMSALSIAAMAGHKDIVKCLLDKGASLDNKQPRFKTALDFALDNANRNTLDKYDEILDLLMNAHEALFYREATAARPERLTEILAHQRIMGMEITRDNMCEFLLTMAQNIPDNDARITLLDNALGDHAFGALMRQPDRYTWTQTSSAVAKIRSELERYINEMPANESSKCSMM